MMLYISLVQHITDLLCIDKTNALLGHINPAVFFTAGFSEWLFAHPPESSIRNPTGNFTLKTKKTSGASRGSRTHTPKQRYLKPPCLPFHHRRFKFGGNGRYRTGNSSPSSSMLTRSDDINEVFFLLSLRRLGLRGGCSALCHFTFSLNGLTLHGVLNHLVGKAGLEPTTPSV